MNKVSAIKQQQEAASAAKPSMATKVASNQYKRAHAKYPTSKANGVSDVLSNASGPSKNSTLNAKRTFAIAATASATQ